MIGLLLFLVLQTSSSYDVDIIIDRNTIVWMVLEPDNPYCQVTVTAMVEMYVVGYWEHQDPDTLYRRIYQTSPIIFTTVIVGVEYDANPRAIEWWARSYEAVPSAGTPFEIVKTCGTVPSRIFMLIFEDGFEGGNTDAWGLVVGDE